MANILIIDDDESMCYALSRMISRMGHTATCACTLSEGLDLVAPGDIDVVFLDVRMPDGNGLEALPKVKKAPSSPEVIIITGFGDPDGAELAIKSGAWDYVEKGCSSKQMTLPLIRALEYRKEKKAVELTQSVVALHREEIIGNSPKLVECLDLLARAAVSES